MPLALCCFIYLYICVAAEVRNNGTEVLIHFDGWSEHYDYWAETTSPELHPVGWHEQCHSSYVDLNPSLQVPRGFSLEFTSAVY